MIRLLYRRPDGSFVAEINSLPYHIEIGSLLYQAAESAAEALGDDLPYEPAPSPHEPTVADYETAIQGHVDETAREKLFRDGVTMATYAASTNAQWAAEAQAFISWRDAVWAYAYTELAQVQSGTRDQPSIEEFLMELPAITWP